MPMPIARSCSTISTCRSGTGLNKIAGKAFRIGHLGDTNELTILGALTGVEMGFELAGVPYKKGGVAAAMSYIAETANPAKAAAEAA